MAEVDEIEMDEHSDVSESEASSKIDESKINLVGSTIEMEVAEDPKTAESSTGKEEGTTTESSTELKIVVSQDASEMPINTVSIASADESEISKLEETTEKDEDEDLEKAETSTVKEDPKLILTSSENANNENREIEMESTSQNSPTPSTSNEDKYAAHITYNEEGTAIYTDPDTKFQYKWSKEKNEWVPLDSEVKKTEDDPYENEHYRWCHETKQWIAKENPKETEFYKWCDETSAWIPKIVQSAANNDKKCRYEDGLHLYTDNDGTIFFWDVDKNAWFPRIDDDFMAQYQMNYGFVDNTSEKSESEVKKVEEKVEVEEKSEEQTEAGKKRKASAEPPKWFDVAPEQNTKIYVSNLPPDITDDEFAEVMAKCGMVMKDIHTQKLKLKLYRDEKGQPKGDGLCNYIRIESVDLALNILDNYDVRGHKIKVERAEFQMRGEYNPALKPKMKKKDKEKIKKIQEKLFDWRPEKMRGERAKHERTVILKNLFEPELFDKEVQLLLDYKKDLREECGKCGTVRKVVVYDRHPEGVAQVTMADADEADLVLQLLNGRFFGKRKLTAEIWDGKTKYKVAETEAEVNKRLDNWEKYLEAKEEAKEAAEKAEAAAPKAADGK